MKIKLLHILGFLIAMQSTVAVADVHQDHQSNKQHLEFNHNDQELDNNNVQNKLEATFINKFNQSDLTYSTTYDCHHCCHCHGVACYYLDILQNDYESYLGSSRLSENLTLFTSRTISPNLRPPIV